MDKLGPAAESVQPLFITVDPEKDRPEQLKDYVRLFHPRLIGLTGEPRQIRKLTSAYKVYYAQTQPSKPTDRGIDHTGYMYLMGARRPVSRFLPARHLGRPHGRDHPAATRGAVRALRRSCLAPCAAGLCR